jgi:putative ABC transport system permease protein
VLSEIRIESLGAISLAASVGLNIVERAREIGVVRALGATARTVNAMFLIESGAVVALSALISFALAVVFTRGLNQMASEQLLHVAVPLHISLTGLALLASGFVLVMLAVWGFLRRMLRISVRDTLAYE